MTLTLADVKHVAELARLELAEHEQSTLLDQLSSILGYMNVLNDVDTEAILPTAQVIEATTVMRDDDVRPSLSRADVLFNAPNVEGAFIRVDAVLDAE